MLEVRSWLAVYGELALEVSDADVMRCEERLSCPLLSCSYSLGSTVFSAEMANEIDEAEL
jgi:hypothetical protein